MNNGRLSPPGLHYGWHIVWSGTLCIFACLGLGRFALGMLLPAMETSLALSYAQMGVLSTANFVGYLLAVLGCGLLIDRLGYRLLIFLALLTIGISMFAIGRAHHFVVILLLYTLTGLGSGAANVPMMALVAHWFNRSFRGRSSGIVVIGSGFAILLSGQLVPYLNMVGGENGWRLNWQILGGLTVLISFICFTVLRNHPRDKGLAACGPAEENKTAAMQMDRKVSSREVIHLGGLYFLFGYTYVIYVTFMVTTLIREHHFSETAAGSFWSLIGFLSLFSGPIFGTLSDKRGRKFALVTVFAIQTASYLLAAFPVVPFFLVLSIFCFGIVAWSIPSIMSALVADTVGPLKAARIFGLITCIFGLGQIAGPAVAGLIAEKTGSFGPAFFMAGCCTLAGLLLAARLKR